jgi:hypothetical protein
LGSLKVDRFTVDCAIRQRTFWRAKARDSLRRLAAQRRLEKPAKGENRCSPTGVAGRLIIITIGAAGKV